MVTMTTSPKTLLSNSDTPHEDMAASGLTYRAVVPVTPGTGSVQLS